MALFKRRQFIIYPKFQYTLVVTNLMILATTLVIIGYRLSASLRYIRGLGEDAKIPEDHLYYKFLAIHENSLLNNLIIASAISFFISTILTVVLSHKISGPIIRLKKHLIRFNENPKYEKLFFRKNDFFSDLPDLVNSSLIKITNKTDQNEFDNEKS